MYHIIEATIIIVIILIAREPDQTNILDVKGITILLSNSVPPSMEKM